MDKLIVFDLDGTLSIAPMFYRTVYSKTLDETVREQRGEDGLRVLQNCRQRFNGKGQIALMALDIPFRLWAQKLIQAPLDLIERDDQLVCAVRQHKAQKAVYTGSPTLLAIRILERIGFEKEDFAMVIGWNRDADEIFPLKWTQTPLVFKTILAELRCEPNAAWSVGDSWDTDLEPAQKIGIRTAGINVKEGNPDIDVTCVLDFLKKIQNGNSA